MKSTERREQEELEEIDRFFKYIKYVTLKEAWTELKTWFFIWALLSFFALGVGYLFSAGVEKSDRVWADIPKPILYFIGFAVITWFMRGAELKVPVSTKLWFYSMLLLGLFALVSWVSPLWVAAPFFFLLFIGIVTLGDLSRKGEANYRRLHEPEERESGYTTHDR